MKTFACQVCKHIAFDESPVDCPVCGAAIENFEKDEEAIKTAADTENLTETEKKHIPVINVNECGLDHDNECTAINIKVGELEHVMESEHLIEFIDFYMNKKYFSRLAFTAKKIHPEASLHLTDTTGTLSAIAYCNVHGSWRTKIKLDDK
jgi:superoxide reductase